MTISTLSYDSLDSSIILLREGGYRADMQFPVLSSYGMSGEAVGTSDRFMQPWWGPYPCLGPKQPWQLREACG